MNDVENNTKTVGVIGAGVIGGGVAHALAQYSFEVILIDLDDETLESARQKILNDVRLSTLLAKDKNSVKSPIDIINQIRFTTDYSHLTKAFFIIENVTETIKAKKTVYSKLDATCSEHTVYAANTSCISITRIGALTNRPDRVVGIHFMNPVPMKPTVEVIRGHHTSDRTLQIADKLLSGIKKDFILVKDSPGFVSNRVLMITINEAIFLLQEHVADARQVDDIFKKCLGHKMGPLETADLIGLDTILHSIEVLYESFNDSKYRPCPLLRKMVDAGQLGRKSGNGFYPYTQGH
jgi:3-hydroxybutyryl-CoA dehydrogenase